MNNKVTRENYKKNYDPLVSFLFSSIFIIIPYVVIWLFSTADFQNQKIDSLSLQLALPLIVLVVSIFLNILFIFIKFIYVKSLTLSIPLNVMFLAMIFSQYLPHNDWTIFIRISITLVLVAISTLITQILLTRFDNKKEFNNIIKK
ncbi:MAG3450 family membrane protein [Mycoplasma sp. Mirounga ES2805-ORL]|uniref:MAG3450 family membrane protein n=1 Tax=Mycoplasma sp. Mirounga ES2805-ORL TaxID=754514 RepID=UPI00197BD329|nr:hypothetical protein [Mycoplasma sp. Mirounga ES2805-ORL]QSF13803.1 hypothetical protein JXZ90_00670 [Mycoplasma sp. Mirounga ES2805-ORL]